MTSETVNGFAGSGTDHSRVAIVGYDTVTPYGRGVDALWNGLLSRESAIRTCRQFQAPAFRGGKAALVSLPECARDRSRTMRLLMELLPAHNPRIPATATLLVATTTGEIDLLETHVLQGTGRNQGKLPDMLPAAAALAGVSGPASVISAACASSTAALAQALFMIRSGETDSVLVIAVDSVSEFLFSGFSALMALDEDVARPFDRERAGLSLGEAAAWFLLMNETQAVRDGYRILGRLSGAAMSSDANHMTGPSRDGAQLARAIRRAMQDGFTAPEDIAAIAAHGTGTRYNDAMEMKALTAVFDRPRPVFSVKGGTGHTMGSAGLVQAVAALETIRHGVAPPTIGLQHADDEAGGWVSSEPQQIDGTAALVVNAGFGGINAAVVLEGRSGRE